MQGSLSLSLSLFPNLLRVRCRDEEQPSLVSNSVICVFDLVESGGERERERIWWNEVEMARGLKWGCSYKRTTLIVCSINIVVALYVLRSLYGSLYIYSNNDLKNGNILLVVLI